MISKEIQPKRSIQKVREVVTFFFFSFSWRSGFSSLLVMSYDKLQFPRVSFHHWLKKQVSEKEKKKITIVFKTSRGVLHFNEKNIEEEQQLNSITKVTILKLQITQGPRDPMMSARGLETLLSLENHCRSVKALVPPQPPLGES